jgi:hypothetical protein
MFFILSKILLFLLNPFNWILVCIVAAFFIKKQVVKKIVIKLNWEYLLQMFLFFKGKLNYGPIQNSTNT